MGLLLAVTNVDIFNSNVGYWHYSKYNDSDQNMLKSHVTLL